MRESRKADKDGLYLLTGMTGSPRYMAPGKLLLRQSSTLHYGFDLIIDISTYIHPPLLNTYDRGRKSNALQ